VGDQVVQSAGKGGFYFDTDLNTTIYHRARGDLDMGLAGAVMVHLVSPSQKLPWTREMMYEASVHDALVTGIRDGKRANETEFIWNSAEPITNAKAFWVAPDGVAVP